MSEVAGRAKSMTCRSGTWRISAESTFVSRMIMIQNRSGLTLCPRNSGMSDSSPAFVNNVAISFPNPPVGRACLDGRAAQNIAYFLFHAAAVPPRTALQSSLDGILDIPNDKLGHGIPLSINDIMISHENNRSKTGRSGLSQAAHSWEPRAEGRCAVPTLPPGRTAPCCGTS